MLIFVSDGFFFDFEIREYKKKKNKKAFHSLRMRWSTEIEYLQSTVVIISFLFFIKEK